MTPDEEPEAAHPARLRVGLIGAGRAGTVLAAALRRAGHEVVAVAAVSETSKARAGRLLPGVPVRPADQVVTEASLALLTVPDDVLVLQLADEGGRLQRDDVPVHAHLLVG